MDFIQLCEVEKNGLRFILGGALCNRTNYRLF